MRNNIIIMKRKALLQAMGNWLFLYVAVGVLLPEPLFSAASGTGALLTLLACFDHDPYE